MHTRNEPGLNIDLSADLETNFTWTPPLTARQTEISLDSPEAITDEELEAGFAEFCHPWQLPFCRQLANFAQK